MGFHTINVSFLPIMRFIRVLGLGFWSPILGCPCLCKLPHKEVFMNARVVFTIIPSCISAPSPTEALCPEAGTVFFHVLWFSSNQG